MKTLYFKSTLLLTAILAAGMTLPAQSVKKDFHKEYTTSGSSELKVDNQFGNITVTEWDQNKVVIDVNVAVTASDDSKAQKILDKIDIEFKEEGEVISAVTKFGEDGKMTVKSGKSEKQSFKIDYTVKCPKTIKLSLDNQFGDLIIGSLNGIFSADLQFGSLNAVSLAGPETQLDMQFGKVTIGSMKDANIDIQHCELLKISECGNLKLDAQFTKVELGSVGSLTADLNNCEVSVDNLAEALKLDSNMGSTTIENVAAGFKSISVDQNMGDLTLGIDPKAGYKINAEVNMGSLKVPEGTKLTREKDSDLPGIKAEKVYGTFGNGSSTITIECNMGSVRIK